MIDFCHACNGTYNKYGSDMSEKLLWTKPDEFQEDIQEKEAQKNDFQYCSKLYKTIMLMIQTNLQIRN